MRKRRTAHRFGDKRRTADVLTEEKVDFSGLMLSSAVLEGLKSAGFERPSPIQLKAIPLGRCGLDLIAQAKSGTGKTCVFSVIALENINLAVTSIQVLVLAPTREIAVQIKDVVCSIGRHMNGLHAHVFIGGMPMEEDKRCLRQCHIAIGTPGRIKHLIENKLLKPDAIRLFILDEADKLLDESFQSQTNWIYSILPASKQMLALSATYTDDLAQHLGNYMKDPTFVRLNASDPSLEGLRHYRSVVPFHSLPHKVFEEKVRTLLRLLSKLAFHQCLIFSNYQIRARNLSERLAKNGWPSTYISGSQGQSERLKAMEKLKEFKCRILISTDLTSRGIDAERVNLVVNMDVPRDSETYLHRVGRAGRFGSYGVAVNFVSEGNEVDGLNKIEEECGVAIEPLPEDITKLLSETAMSEIKGCHVSQDPRDQIAKKMETGNVVDMKLADKDDHVGVECKGKEVNVVNADKAVGEECASKEMGEDHANEVVLKRGNGVGGTVLQEAKGSVETDDFDEETHQRLMDKDRSWNDCKAHDEHESFLDFGADKKEFDHNVGKQVGMFEQKRNDEKCLNKDGYDIETSQLKRRKLPALENHNGYLETLEKTPDKMADKIDILHTHNDYMKISSEKPNDRKRLEDSDDLTAISEGSCSENRGPLDLGEHTCAEEQRGKHGDTKEYLGEYLSTEERPRKLCGTKDLLGEDTDTEEQRGKHCGTEEYLGGHFGTGEYFGGHPWTEERPGELCCTEEQIGGHRDTNLDLGKLCDTNVGEHRGIEEHFGELSLELKEKRRGIEEHVEEQCDSRQSSEEKGDKELSEKDFGSENLSEKIYDDEESLIQQLYDRGISSEKLRKADKEKCHNEVSEKNFGSECLFEKKYDDEESRRQQLCGRMISSEELRKVDSFDTRLPLRKRSDQNPFGNHVCYIQNFGEHFNAKNVENKCLDKTLVSEIFDTEQGQTNSESDGYISCKRFNNSRVKKNPVIFRRDQTGDSFMKMETVALPGGVGESEGSSCEETGSESSHDTPRDLSQVPISSQDFDNALEAYLEASTSRKSENVAGHSEEISEKVVEPSKETSESNVAKAQPNVLQHSDEISESNVSRESQPLVKSPSQSRKAGKSATLVPSVDLTERRALHTRTKPDRNENDVINQQPELVGSTADTALGNDLRESRETGGDPENSMFYSACADDATVYLSALPANWKQAWYQAYERQTKFISTYTQLYRGALH